MERISIILLGTGTIDINTAFTDTITSGAAATNARLLLEEANVFVNGDINNTNDNFRLIASTGTITFDDTTGTTNITNVTGTFGNVVIADGDGGSDLIVQLAGTLDMIGTLVINDGSLETEGYEVFVDGNVDINDELDLSSWRRRKYNHALWW